MKNFVHSCRAVMFHIGRCGSTVIGDMLNQHSKIFWAGEIFEKYMTTEKEKAKKDRFVELTIDWSSQSDSSEIYGFETKYLPQLHLSSRCINMNLEEYIRLLRNMNFNKFIVLQRRNYLRRAISAEIGRKNKKWHSKNEVVKSEQIILNTNSFKTGTNIESILELFRTIDVNYRFLKELLRQDDTLFLNYEDDILDNPNIAYQKICRFISVDVESPKISMYRTNPFSYEEMVINFEEVRKELLGTKYSWMLND